MSRTKLQVARGLGLPLDFATESIGVIGQRGSGKSNALVVLAEEMYDAEIPWFAIDPKGDWWGIRSNASGDGSGLSVPVFGGLHGDAPLTPDMGVAMADLLVDENLTAVLDVSRFTGGELSRFLVDFCHRLFRRHQEEPHVRHGFLEEAHRYIPQQVTGRDGSAAMKEACAKLPLEGRSFGLGTSTATQRPARLHKDVTTQFGTLAVGRIMAKQDRDAVAGWFAEQEVGTEALGTLQALEPGEMWVLSPLLGVFERAVWRQRRTFDSGATPKVGEAKRVPKRLADVDLEVIAKRLAEAIERAEENDPKALRRRLALVQTTLAAREKLLHDIAVARRGESPDVDEHWERIPKEIRGMWEQINERADGQPDAPFVTHEELATFDRLADVLMTMGPTVNDLVARLNAHLAGEETYVEPQRRPIALVPPPREDHPSMQAPRPRAVNAGGPLTNPQRKVLTVLATYGAVNKRRLAMQAGYSAKGGAFNNVLSQLRTMGAINRGPTVEITDFGREVLGDYEPLPRGAALIQHWLQTVTAPQAKILAELIHVGPLPKDELARRCDYEPSGGAFNNNLSALRTLELIGRGQPVALTPDFREAIDA